MRFEILEDESKNRKFQNLLLTHLGLTTPLHCVVISKIPFASHRGPKGSSNSHLLRVKERCVMEYPFSFCSWELCGQAVRAVVFRISVTGHITDSFHFCFVHCDNPLPMVYPIAKAPTTFLGTLREL